MLSNLIAQSLIFLPLVFNNGAAVNQPVVIGIGPDEPITTTVTITQVETITETAIVRPSVPFTKPYTYEAHGVTVDIDGYFSLVADENVYGGCLKTIEYVNDFPEGIIQSNCSQLTGATDGIKLYEDGAGIWDLGTGESIGACFLPSWGCSVSDSRSWLVNRR